MYRINTANGDIHNTITGEIISTPYATESYQEYAAWVNAGNSPEEFHIPPPIPVPESITRFQARAALYEAGFLDEINTIINAPETPMLFKLAWSDAQEFRRDSPAVQVIADALNMSHSQVDDLFRAATLISA